MAVIGSKALRELTAADVRQALIRSATTRSTRAVEISRNCLVRAIRHAEANDRVRRNVAALVHPPRGRQGRPSKAMTLEQVTRQTGDASHARPGTAQDPRKSPLRRPRSFRDDNSIVRIGHRMHGRRFSGTVRQQLPTDTKTATL